MSPGLAPAHDCPVADGHRYRFGGDLDETDPDKARLLVDKMCDQLLTNSVIENYSFELEAA